MLTSEQIPMLRLRSSTLPALDAKVSSTFQQKTSVFPGNQIQRFKDSNYDTVISPELVKMK